jgi:hypothetical protein
MGYCGCNCVGFNILPRVIVPISLVNLHVQYNLWTNVLAVLVYTSVSDAVQGTRCCEVLCISQCPVYMYLMTESSTCFPICLNVWCTFRNLGAIQSPMCLTAQTPLWYLQGAMWCSVYRNICYNVDKRCSAVLRTVSTHYMVTQYWNPKVTIWVSLILGSLMFSMFI